MSIPSWLTFTATSVVVDPSLQLEATNAQFDNVTVTGTINGGMTSASIVPDTDNVYNIGAVGARFQNLYLGTNAIIDGQADLTANTNQLVLSHSAGNSTTINVPAPAANRVYDVPDVGSNGTIVVANSTNDITVNQLNYTTLNPPVAAGYNPVRAAINSSTVKSFTDSTQTSYEFTVPNILSDPFGIYTGGGVFTPNVAGNYVCTAQLRYQDAILGSRSVELFKNGAQYIDALSFIPVDVVGRGTPIVSAVINFNGTTDTLQVFGLQDSGSPVDVIWGSLSLTLVD